MSRNDFNLFIGLALAFNWCIAGILMGAFWGNLFLYMLIWGISIPLSVGIVVLRNYVNEKENWNA